MHRAVSSSRQRQTGSGTRPASTSDTAGWRKNDSRQHSGEKSSDMRRVVYARNHHPENDDGHGKRTGAPAREKPATRRRFRRWRPRPYPKCPLPDAQQARAGLRRTRSGRRSWRSARGPTCARPVARRRADAREGVTVDEKATI